MPDSGKIFVLDRKGKEHLAPQYNIHKLFMGLIDVYRMMEQPKALSIADKLADWFYRWSGRYTREEFDDILDMEPAVCLRFGQTYMKLRVRKNIRF